MDCRHCIYRKRSATNGKEIIVNNGDTVKTDVHIKVKCMASDFAVIDKSQMKCSEEMR